MVSPHAGEPTHILLVSNCDFRNFLNLLLCPEGVGWFGFPTDSAGGNGGHLQPPLSLFENALEGMRARMQACFARDHPAPLYLHNFATQSTPEAGSWGNG